MSVHPSLSTKSKGKQHRSVLKRYERLKQLQEKEKWKPGDSIFGLLKLKAIRWKVKKAKKAAEAEGAEAAVTEAGAATEQKPATGKEEKPTKK